jgi:hypothetical protein
MTNSITGIMAQGMPAIGNGRFTSYFDTAQVPLRNIQSFYFKLIRGGLSENITGSRPEKIIGELGMVPPKSSARALLKFAGTWAGDDLEHCLEEMYLTRGEAEL